MAKGFEAPVRAAQVRATRDTAGAEYHRESKLHRLERSVLYLFQQPQPQRISAVAATGITNWRRRTPPPQAQTRERAPRARAYTIQNNLSERVAERFRALKNANVAI